VAESGEEESGHEKGHDCTIRMLVSRMSEAAKAPKFPTSALRRQVLQKRPGLNSCKCKGQGQTVQVSRALALDDDALAS
jgi:hypothetical protein